MRLHRNSTICSVALIAALVISIGVLAGCGGGNRGDRSNDSAMRATESDRRATESDRRATESDRRASESARRTASTSDGVSRVSAYFPQGIKAILVERSAPSNVREGQPFDQYIKLTNVSDVTVRDIDLTHYLAENFTLAKTSPNAKSVADGRAKWFFDELGPG